MAFRPHLWYSGSMTPGRTKVKITVTVVGELDPVAVKAEAFGRAASRPPEKDSGLPDDISDQIASVIGGSLRTSVQTLVPAAEVRSMLERALPSFKVPPDRGLSIVVDVPDLGPEDGGGRIVGWPM